MTQRLYDDAYIKDFDATVTGCIERDGAYCVTLDKTAFFPEGGGQSSDVGFLDSIPVTYVYARDQEIYHVTEQALPVGARVQGHIDWSLRFHNMQNHTGEHIVSGVLHSMFGYENVGFHLSREEVTLDTSGELSREELLLVERKANEIVTENIPVKIWYPDSLTLAELAYRSKLDLTQNVRIVTIGAYDNCACCAPHVDRTGAVGLIKLLDAIRYKGGMRIRLKCGFSALDDYNDKYENVRRISSWLSAKQTEAAEAVQGLFSQITELKNMLATQKKRYMDLRLAQPDCAGEIVFVIVDGFDRNDLRELANRGIEKANIFVAFSPISETEFCYVCAGRSDVRALTADMNLALSGKGGGSAKMTQGSVHASAQEISAFGRAYV